MDTSLRVDMKTLLLLKEIKAKMERDHVRPLSYDYVLNQIIEKAERKIVIVNWKLLFAINGGKPEFHFFELVCKAYVFSDDVKRMKLELEKEKLQWRKNKESVKGLAWIIDWLESDDEDDDQD